MWSMQVAARQRDLISARRCIVVAAMLVAMALHVPDVGAEKYPRDPEAHRVVSLPGWSSVDDVFPVYAGFLPLEPATTTGDVIGKEFFYILTEVHPDAPPQAHNRLILWLNVCNSSLCVLK